MRSSRSLPALGGLLLLLLLGSACDDPAVLAWGYLDTLGTPRERRGGVLVETTEPVRLRGDVIEEQSVQRQRINCFTEPCPQPKATTTTTWSLEHPGGKPPKGWRRRVVLGLSADAAQRLKQGERCLVTGVLYYPQQPSQGPDGTVSNWSSANATLTLNHWRLEECETPRRFPWW